MKHSTDQGLGLSEADAVHHESVTVSRAVAWFSSGLGVILGRAGQVISSWVLARHLSETDFGTFLLAVATANTAVGFLGYGLYASASHFMSEALPLGRTEISRAFSTILLAAILLLGIAACLLALNVDWFTGTLMKAPHVAKVFRLLLVAIVALAFARCAEGILFGIRKFSIVVLMKGIGALVGVASMIVLGLRWGCHGAIMGFVLGSLSLGIGLCAAAGHGVVSLRVFGVAPSRTMFLRVARMILLLSMTSTMVLAATWAGQVFLARESGMEAVGLFGPGNQLRNLLGMLPGTLGAATIPFMSECYSRDGDKGMRDIATDYSAVLLLLLGPTCILLIGWSQEVLALLYGARAVAGWPIANLLFLGLLVQLPTLVMGYVIIARSEAIYGVLVNLAWGAIFLGCCWWSVPKYGATGVAASVLVSAVLQVPLCYLYLVSRKAFTPRRLVAPYVCLLLAAIVAYFTARSGGVAIRLTTSSLLAAGLFAMVFFAAFPVQQRQRLNRIIHRALARRAIP